MKLAVVGTNYLQGPHKAGGLTGLLQMFAQKFRIRSKQSFINPVFENPNPDIRFNLKIVTSKVKQKKESNKIVFPVETTLETLTLERFRVLT